MFRQTSTFAKLTLTKNNILNKKFYLLDFKVAIESPKNLIYREFKIILLNFLERAKGFEPSTSTLARLRSTPELRPQYFFLLP